MKQLLIVLTILFLFSCKDKIEVELSQPEKFIQVDKWTKTIEFAFTGKIYQEFPIGDTYSEKEIKTTTFVSQTNFNANKFKGEFIQTYYEKDGQMWKWRQEIRYTFTYIK